ncbi:MAG: hypothetical protein HC838_03190 [Spirulinaceae cyanobacterium RM2_2_10]|nr:hypothetical protein [Spirulinaceae cyanobacterium SM2_1_0]NJO19262.1 hypothetical protein [Spirulinaceae cyanobacterium RM2_2_10]
MDRARFTLQPTEDMTEWGAAKRSVVAEYGNGERCDRTNVRLSFMSAASEGRGYSDSRLTVSDRLLQA